MDATKSNENLLNRIGSDIHDGPIQLLSLLILRLVDRPAARTRRSPLPMAETDAAGEFSPPVLARRLLAELRELSAGLVLPEIESLSLDAALRLAVEYHEKVTGTTVEASYNGLPEQVAQPLKLCLYRVIQEGLTNAFRHAGGRGQRVTVSANDKFITVVVSDGGPGLANASEASVSRKPLGLHGIRNRVEAFGGAVKIRQRDDIGTELSVLIPLESNSL